MTRITADWLLNDPERVGGLQTTCSGNPSPGEKAPAGSVSFDGRRDGMFLQNNPLRGLTSFTVEAIFLPLQGGPDTQKFIHFGEALGERFLFETRVPDPEHWCFDAALHSGEPSLALMDPGLLHPLGHWYHAAVVFDGRFMQTWINGEKELSGKISAFSPINGERTSIGTRMDRNSWYKGEISRIRVTEGILSPGDFMDIHE